MDWVNIVWAGIVATAVMTGVMYLGVLEAASREVSALWPRSGRRVQGAVVLAGQPQVDVVGMIGRLLTSDPKWALAAGMGAHLMMGLVAAVIYGLVWRVANSPATWWTGLGLGLIHGLLVTLALPVVVRALAQWRPQRLGPFLHGGAVTRGVVLGSHAAFGLVLGLLYSPL